MISVITPTKMGLVMQNIKTKPTKNIIHLNVKCSDMFAATLSQDGQQVGEYDGYVPDWMPGEHYGDYVQLDIDTETGKILNWKCPSRRDLFETFQRNGRTS